MINEAKLRGVDEHLARAVAKHESAFNPAATSPVGAAGVMQLMPSAQQDMGVENPYDPDENIRGGVRLLKQLQDKYPGDLQKAIQAYHAGPGNVDAGKIGPATRDYTAKVMASRENFAGIPPAPEGFVDIEPVEASAIPPAPEGFVDLPGEVAAPIPGQVGQVPNKLGQPRTGPQIQAAEAPPPPGPAFINPQANRPYESIRSLQPKTNAVDVPILGTVNIPGAARVKEEIADTPVLGDAVKAGQEFRELIWAPAEGTPLKSDSKLETVINGFLRGAAGFTTPEAVATWIAGAGVARALPALANSPTAQALLKANPVLAKGVDIAANGAVPLVFGVMGTTSGGKNIASGIEAGDMERVAQGLLELGVGGAALSHAVRGGKATLARFPGEADKPPAAAPGSMAEKFEVPVPPTEQEAATARAKAEAAESEGAHLAAQQWRDLAQYTSPVKVNLGELGVGSVIPMRPEPVRDQTTGKLRQSPLIQFHVVDQTGKTLVAGDGGTVSHWLRIHSVAEPSARAGGAVSVGAGAPEVSELPQVSKPASVRAAGEPPRAQNPAESAIENVSGEQNQELGGAQQTTAETSLPNWEKKLRAENPPPDFEPGQRVTVNLPGGKTAQATVETIEDHGATRGIEGGWAVRAKIDGEDKSLPFLPENVSAAPTETGKTPETAETPDTRPLPKMNEAMQLAHDTASHMVDSAVEDGDSFRIESAKRHLAFIEDLVRKSEYKATPPRATAEDLTDEYVAKGLASDTSPEDLKTAAELAIEEHHAETQPQPESAADRGPDEEVVEEPQVTAPAKLAQGQSFTVAAGERAGDYTVTRVTPRVVTFDKVVDGKKSSGVMLLPQFQAMVGVQPQSAPQSQPAASAQPAGESLPGGVSGTANEPGTEAGSRRGGPQQVGAGKPRTVGAESVPGEQPSEGEPGYVPQTTAAESRPAGGGERPSSGTVGSPEKGAAPRSGNQEAAPASGKAVVPSTSTEAQSANQPSGQGAEGERSNVSQGFTLGKSPVSAPEKAGKAPVAGEKEVIPAAQPSPQQPEKPQTSAEARVLNIVRDGRLSQQTIDKEFKRFPEGDQRPLRNALNELIRRGVVDEFVTGGGETHLRIAPQGKQAAQQISSRPQPTPATPTPAPPKAPAKKLTDEEIATEVRTQLDSLRTRHAQQQAAVRRDLEALPKQISETKKLISNIAKDIETRNAAEPGFKIDGKLYTGEGSRKEAAKALGEMLAKRHAEVSDVVGSQAFPIGEYKGFRLIGRDHAYAKGDRTWADIFIRGEHVYESNNFYGGDTPEGMGMSLIQSIEAKVRGIEAVGKTYDGDLETLNKKLADNQKLAGQPFEQAKKLEDMLVRQRELDTQLRAPTVETTDATNSDETGEVGDIDLANRVTPERERENQAGLIANYQAGQGRLKTPDAGFYYGDVDGKPYYSNGHLLAPGEAPGKKGPFFATISKVLHPNGETAPIAAAAFEERPNAEDPNPKRVIWFSDATAVDARYYDHLLKKFPAASFSLGKQANGTPAVYVKDGAVTVGVIMPLKASEPPANVRALIDSAAPAAVSPEVSSSEPEKPETPLERLKKLPGEESGSIDLRKAALGMRAAKRSLQRILTPAALAPETALTIRQRAAELARASAVAEAALESSSRALMQLPEQERWDFYDRVERGEQQPDPRFEEISKVFRSLLDSARKDVQDLGTGKLQKFIENYLPHIYKDPEVAERIFKEYYAKRPMEGSKSFLKRRKFETLKDAVEATDEDGNNLGLEPVTGNPVDMVLIKLREMQKYVMAHRVLNDEKAEGRMTFVRAGREAPVGWKQINDKIGTVYGPPTIDVEMPAVLQSGVGQIGGMLGTDVPGAQYTGTKTEAVYVPGIRIMGNYYAPEDSARLINNYLSPGLRGDPVFRAYLTAANTLNQFQLGFSAFHLTFTSLDTATSKLALGIYQAAHGHPVQGVKSAIQAPVAAFTGIFTGDKMLKEYYKPGSQGAEIGDLVDAMVMAGGRARMDTFYQAQAAQTMSEIARRATIPGRIFGAALAGTMGHLAAGPVGAVIGGLAGGTFGGAGLADIVARPIMQYVVPRQKMAVFADLARFELQRLSEGRLSPKDVEAALARAWDSVDNRLGQLVYDNLFWNKTFKDVLMGTVRSVGWNTGTIREVLGGATDLRKLALDEGMSTRLSYMIALPVLIGLAGSLLYRLATGEDPETLKDRYFPRSGPRGTPGWSRRWSLPSYVKDVVHVHQKGVWETAKGKLHPLITLAAEMLSNKDYFDKPIRNANDEFVKQFLDEAKFVLESTAPLSLKSPHGAKNTPPLSPRDRALYTFGINQAPAYIQDQQKPPRKQQYHQSQF